MKVRQGLFAGSAAVIVSSLPEGERAASCVLSAAAVGLRGQAAHRTRLNMTPRVAEAIGAKRSAARSGSAAVDGSRFPPAACRAGRIERETAITRKSDKESVRGGLMKGQGLAQSDDPIVEICPNGRQCLVCQEGCS